MKGATDEEKLKKAELYEQLKQIRHNDMKLEQGQMKDKVQDLQKELRTYTSKEQDLLAQKFSA